MSETAFSFGGLDSIPDTILLIIDENDTPGQYYDAVRDFLSECNAYLVARSYIIPLEKLSSDGGRYPFKIPSAIISLLNNTSIHTIEPRIYFNKPLAANEEEFRKKLGMIKIIMQDSDVADTISGKYTSNELADLNIINYATRNVREDDSEEE